MILFEEYRLAAVAPEEKSGYTGRKRRWAAAVEKGIGCVVMAAGLGARFGGGKLWAELEGRSLIRRALEAVPADRVVRTAVVSGDREILRLAAEFGFQPVENPRPEAGAAGSLRLGLRAVMPCQGALFLVADQPLLRRETVSALADFWLAEPEGIAALGCGGRRGNPCLFPERFFPELLALEGDRGGGQVIDRHPEALRLMETDGVELMDVDRPEDLERMGKSRR